MDANLVYVDAVDRFLDKLAGVAEPEKKRKIIGAEFIRVFEEEAKKFMQTHHLTEQETDTLSFSTDDERKNLFKKLTQLYENASNYEIERAIDEAIDRYGTHPEEKPFFEYLRMKLED